MSMKVVIRAAVPYESSSENPLGAGRAPHRIWNWSDGSWLLIRFLDDGPMAVTSPGISASLDDRGDSVLVRVAPAATKELAPAR